MTYQSINFNNYYSKVLTILDYLKIFWALIPL